MNSVWKRTRRIAVGLGLTVIVVLGLWVGLVPSIIERVVTTQLEQAGLPKPGLRVRSLSLTHLEMTSLMAGENGRLRISAIGIDYSILQLLRKRVDAIEIVGFETEIRRKDGAWDLGPLADLHGSGETPFKRVVVRASTLLLDIDGRRLRIPFRGTVESASHDALEIDLTADVEGATLRITGTVNTKTGDFDLACSGDVPELASLLAAAPPEIAATPERAWGGLTLTSTLTRDQGELSLDARVASNRPGLGARFGRHEIAVDTLSLAVAVKLDKTLVLKSLECSAAARGLVAGGFPVFVAAATLKKGGEAFTLDASAEGTGWKLSRLEAGETGLEDWLRGKADRARVQFQWGAVSDRPWLLLEASPLRPWIEGEALAKAEVSGDGILELGRARADKGAGWTWSATVPRAVATLAPSDLAIPSAGATLEGVRADLRVAARASAEGLRLELLPHSLVSAAGLSVRYGDACFVLARGEKPGIELCVGERPVAASVSFREGDPAWKVEAPDVRLTLAECSLPLPGAAGKVEGLAAALAFRADADPKRAVARMLPGSWIGLKSAEVKAGAEIVRVGAARLAFAERGKQPLLAVGLDGGRLLSASGALAAETTGPVIASAGEGATVQLGTVRSVAEGAWSEEDAAFAGSLEISAADASLKGKFGASPVAASMPEAVLSVRARRAFPAGSGPEAPLSVEFVVGTPQGGRGVSAAVAGAEVAAGSVEAWGTATLAGAAPPAINARVSLADGSVRHKEAGLALAGITASVPIAWNTTTPPEAGRFDVKSIELKGNALPALSGTLGVADTRADFTVAWEPLPGAKLKVEGSAAAGPRGPSARAYVSLPLFPIKDEEALGRLVPSLKGVLVSGSFALDGYVRVSPDGAVPNIALTILDGTFKSKAWEAEAEGVYATVRINSFAPALTPRKELQVVLVRHAKMGKLDVSDGFVAFRLEPKQAEGRPTGWTAYVQRGEWGWVGGRLYVEDLRFDPEAKEHTVTVYARDLKLGDLLALIPNEQASGVGSLDGQLTVTIGTWPNLRFGNGKLRTAAGQTGWFKIKNAAVLGTVLEGTDNRFRTDNLYMEIKNRFIGAFGNFEYDALNVDFIRDGETFVARVNTKGRARTGSRQEFGEVTLNFQDLDLVLRDAILISRRVFGK